MVETNNENTRPGGNGRAKDMDSPEFVEGGLPNVYGRKLHRIESRSLRAWEGVGKNSIVRANFRYWTF